MTDKTYDDGLKEGYLAALRKCQREWKELNRVVFENFIDVDAAWVVLEERIYGLIKRKKESL